jgi:hypothetical protein
MVFGKHFRVELFPTDLRGLRCVQSRRSVRESAGKSAQRIIRMQGQLRTFDQSMTAEHSALESPLSAKILLPFCYRFCDTSVQLETKVSESVLKSSTLKWKKKQGVPQFCWLFEFAAADSRYRYQTQETPIKPLEHATATSTVATSYRLLVMPLVRFCAGGDQRWSSLPRQSAVGTLRAVRLALVAISLC